MIWKTISDDQLFVYRDGELIYKKWLKMGVSCVMNAFGMPSWNVGRYVNLDEKKEAK